MLTHDDWIKLIPTIIAIVGWPISTYFGYRFGLRSQKLARENAKDDARRGRRAQFIEAANFIKNTIDTSNRNPGKWISIFKNNAATFLTAYDSTKSELNGVEEQMIGAAMNTVSKFARMNHSEIDQNEDELFAALKKIPEK